jgi:endo-1,4-beta-xylanase
MLCNRRRALGLLAGAAQMRLSAEEPALKDLYENSFLVGAALNQSQFTEHDKRGLPIILKHFNSITPENVLKWVIVHPKPDTYNFEPSDQFVAFGEKHRMVIIGHTLVWHNQTPAWVFDGDRETLLKRMRDHILTVAGRYKGRIKGWDVVNEALNEDGTLRQSPWMKIVGEDYIEKAFLYAHEADPQAELYYNDYSVENEAKRRGAVDLIRKLKAKGIPVAGIGLQGHNDLEFPGVEQQEATIAAFAKLGVKVMITELDLDVLPAAGSGGNLNPHVDGLPESIHEKQARRYADLFAVYRKYKDVITRVTFWGVTDGDSWKNNWPLRGRTNYPLLFDRFGQPKPAFHAVAGAAKN